MTVSRLGRLRLTLVSRVPRFGGLWTAGAPRIASAMSEGAIEPDEHPTGRVSNIGRCNRLKEPGRARLCRGAHRCVVCCDG